MLGICIPYSRNEQTIGQWDFVLSHWPIDVVYLYNTTNNEWIKHNPFKHAVPILTASELPAGHSLILLAPTNGMNYQGDVNLNFFVHPEDAIYIIGPDNIHMSDGELGSCIPDSIVYIPTTTNDQMYSYTAAAVMLYDRQLKTQLS